MSLRLEMSQVARRASRALGEGAARVREYLAEQWTEDGGARDRSGRSDLYYTPFLLGAEAALGGRSPAKRVAEYLRSFESGEGLDLVHLASLVRAWKALGRAVPPDLKAHAAGFLAERRTACGGFDVDPDRDEGSLYAAFLALGVLEDLELEVPRPDRLADGILRLRTPDGGFADTAGLAMGTTPSTAAAATLLRRLGRDVPESAGAWLLARASSRGGFRAVPEAPLPDLLSTATALHALAGLGVSFEGVREPSLDFLDSLWTGRAFVATWEDDEPDSEYVFYGLLALGHLST